jgi:hypothetical protein
MQSETTVPAKGKQPKDHIALRKENDIKMRLKIPMGQMIGRTYEQAKMTKPNTAAPQCAFPPPLRPDLRIA